MSGKRSHSETSGSGSSGSQSEPPKKKVLLDMFKLGTVSSIEEIEMQTLKFQYKKIGQRLVQKNRIEQDLRKRIEELEKRQLRDDDLLHVMNRYWNQFNEDVRLLLERFNAEAAADAAEDEEEEGEDSEGRTSFIAHLSDPSELDEKLAHRVQVSQRAVAKIVQTFESLMKRNRKLSKQVRSAKPKDSDEAREEDGASAPTEDKGSEEKDEDSSSSPPPDGGGTAAALLEAVKEELAVTKKENERLHRQNTKLHEEHRKMRLKLAVADERVSALDTRLAEQRNRLEESEYEREQLTSKTENLESFLSDSQERIKVLESQVAKFKERINPGDKSKPSADDLPPSDISQRKLSELQFEVEIQTELAAQRLAELEKLNGDYKQLATEVEQLKVEMKHIPVARIHSSHEYQSLQCQFSLLYNDHVLLRQTAEDCLRKLAETQATHMKQIEQMEADELIGQKKLRAELILLEDSKSQLQKEYEMLRIEFEQTMAAHEQMNQMHREMKHIITSLQSHNGNLKKEVARHKKKSKDLAQELHKRNKEISELRNQLHTHQASLSRALANNAEGRDSKESVGSGSTMAVKSEGVKAEGDIKKEPGVEGEDGKEKSSGPPNNLVKKESPSEEHIKRDGSSSLQRRPSSSSGSSSGGMTGSKPKPKDDYISDLRNALKKCQAEQKDMRFLLETYKQLPKETRDKAQIAASERKTRAELEQLKGQYSKLLDSRKEDAKRVTDEAAHKKLKHCEEKIDGLQKTITAQKQEEDALLNEMEVTGQAFEDMQDQNIRLVQLLKEKDEVNFKLMGDRIKSQQIQKVHRKEKDVLEEQVRTLTSQLEAQSEVVLRLEERDRILHASVSSFEQQLMNRAQMTEAHRRKALEAAQSAADLRLHLDKYTAQLKDMQHALDAKSSLVEEESFRLKRAQEEVWTLKKKFERAQRMIKAGGADTVLLEEIRDYKEQLTCPSCKVKKKDAVLRKCFHVFCFDCLRTRYETRQRKCPKCNAAFGANDYHRLYLT